MNRSYLRGLLTGGLVGTILGTLFSGRAKREGSSSTQGAARKIFRGISRGMLEMLRR